MKDASGPDFEKNDVVIEKIGNTILMFENTPLRQLIDFGQVFVQRRKLM